MLMPSAFVTEVRQKRVHFLLGEIVEAQRQPEACPRKFKQNMSEAMGLAQTGHTIIQFAEWSGIGVFFSNWIGWICDRTIV